MAESKFLSWRKTFRNNSKPRLLTLLFSRYLFSLPSKNECFLYFKRIQVEGRGTRGTRKPNQNVSGALSDVKTKVKSGKVLTTAFLHKNK